MSTSLHTNAVDVQTRDHMEDMIHNLGQEGFRHAHAPYYEKLQTDSKKPLYIEDALKDEFWIMFMHEELNQF